MREYIIEEYSDFKNMVQSFEKHFKQCKEKCLKFPQVKITAKRLRKSKTSRQHKAYWRCIGELKKAFLEAGYRFNEEEIHYFIKTQAGFTKVKELPNGKTIVVAKSISDESEDVNISNINFLIEFMLEYAATNLNYFIDLGY